MNSKNKYGHDLRGFIPSVGMSLFYINLNKCVRCMIQALSIVI